MESLLILCEENQHFTRYWHEQLFRFSALIPSSITFHFSSPLQLGGIAILAVGVAFLLQIGDIEKVFEDWNITVVPILFIVIGAVIFVIAFFGCCGAIKESHCMTVTYSTFLMILLIAQIILAIVVFVYVGDIQKSVQPVLERLWQNRLVEVNQRFWDNVQTNVRNLSRWHYLNCLRSQIQKKNYFFLAQMLRFEQLHRMGSYSEFLLRIWCNIVSWTQCFPHWLCNRRQRFHFNVQ